MTLRIINCEQNSEEWIKARLGIPTASAFSKILAKGEGKTRGAYLLDLAGEILTGKPASSWEGNEHTERGHEMEDDVRRSYVFQTGAELTRVGFVTDGKKGCSPDSLIGLDGGLEIKTTLPRLLIEIRQKREIPHTHIAQVQGSMWVCGRAWWDVAIASSQPPEPGYPGVPTFIKRVLRNEAYIQTLATEVDKFIAELAQTVARDRVAA